VPSDTKHNLPFVITLEPSLEQDVREALAAMAELDSWSSHPGSPHRNRAMKHLLILLISAVAWTQVAEHANKGLKTEEGRKEMLGMLSGRNGSSVSGGQAGSVLGLKKGDTVVDLGTGAGMLLPFLSEAVGPIGRVLAEEITKDFLDKARENARQHGLSNVEFVLDRKGPQPAGEWGGPGGGGGHLHHFNYPAEMLACVRKALRPEGSSW
jgi:SAM-dependent methyltransferase